MAMCCKSNISLKLITGKNDDDSNHVRAVVTCQKHCCLHCSQTCPTTVPHTPPTRHTPLCPSTSNTVKPHKTELLQWTMATDGLYNKLRTYSVYKYNNFCNLQTQHKFIFHFITSFCSFLLSSAQQTTSHFTLPLGSISDQCLNNYKQTALKSMQNASQDRQSEIFSTAMKTNEFVQLERNHDDDYTEQTKPDANRSLINSFSFVAVTNSG